MLNFQITAPKICDILLLPGAYPGGGLWGPRPPGVTKGAQKKKKKGKKERREKKKGKKGKGRKERWVNQHDEKGAIQGWDAPPHFLWR